MLLTGRNTYKTRRVMLLYCVLCLSCLMLFVIGLGASFIHPFWWVHGLNIMFVMGFFFTFFLLALENNNYNIRYYYSKKKFKILFNDLLHKYKIDNKKVIRKIKKIAKDYFYQFGTIDIKACGIDVEIFDDWLNKHTYNHIKDKEQIFDYFLYELLGTSYLGGDYKERLYHLVNIYKKEYIIERVDECKYINADFKDKIIFVYDYTSFVSDNFLKNMYIELLLIIECYLDLIDTDEFNSMMYNSNYYYSEDKRIAYVINNDDNEFNIVIKNFMYSFEESVFLGCKSEEEALKIIRDNLERYNNGKDE